MVDEPIQVSQQIDGQTAQAVITGSSVTGLSTAGQRLPNLVIAGTVKGGTTSLWTYLAAHTDICSSSIKETCYFSVHRYGKWDSRYDGSPEPFKQFQGYFSHCRQQRYVMEATPGYFQGGERLAREMKTTLGDRTKIMIVLRNPVNRFISFWKYKKSMLELAADLSLQDYLEMCQQATLEDLGKAESALQCGLQEGYYANQMDEWFDVFGESLKVLFFDDLKKDARALLADISQWLEIDDTVFDTVDLSVQNRSVGYKNARLQKLALMINNKAEKFWRSNQALKNTLRQLYYMLNAQPHQEQVDEAILRQLEEIYTPYNRKLAQQLKAQGYDQLPDWLEKTL